MNQWHLGKEAYIIIWGLKGSRNPRPVIDDNQGAGGNVHPKRRENASIQS